jgi:hypothetical protein
MITVKILVYKKVINDLFCYFSYDQPYWVPVHRNAAACHIGRPQLENPRLKQYDRLMGIVIKAKLYFIYLLLVSKYIMNYFAGLLECNWQAFSSRMFLVCLLWQAVWKQPILLGRWAAIL